jgi:dienelactone hydrolase
MVSRRGLLLGSAGTLAGLVAAGAGAAYLAHRGVIPGKSAVDRDLGFCDVDVPVAQAGRPLVDGNFRSVRRGRQVTFQVAYPHGIDPPTRLPVCIALHGFGGDSTSALTAPNLPGYLAAAVSAGAPPFAYAAVDGGDGYWHPHPDDDPLGMLLDEFPGELARVGLNTDRLAITGFSMGGFGALLAALTRPGRFVRVVANSPAFWRTYDEAAHVNPGAFTDAAEWTKYGDLLERAGELNRLPFTVDIGASDSFTPIVETLRDRLGPGKGLVTISKGCHDETYWRHVAPAQVVSVANALAAA